MKKKILLFAAIVGLTTGIAMEAKAFCLECTIYTQHEPGWRPGVCYNNECSNFTYVGYGCCTGTYN